MEKKFIPYKGFGLGCGRFSNADDTVLKESIAVIHAAKESGITFLNTADFYESGASEMAIGEAVKGQSRENFYISVKFGALVGPKGNMYGLDVHPHRIKNYLTQSLRRMKLDYIDLYQPARIDNTIPVEETIGAITELVKEGYVRHIGLTQTDVITLEKAHKVHPITYYESEYSLFNRNMKKNILPVTRELGIGVVAFGILAHSLLGGAWTKERAAAGELHSRIELFRRENIEKNLRLVDNLKIIAKEKQVTLSQLVHAWALSKGNDIIPLIGVSKLTQFQETLKARDIQLTDGDIRRIEEAIPQNEIAGNSFPNMQFHNGIAVRLIIITLCQ